MIPLMREWNVPGGMPIFEQQFYEFCTVNVWFG